MASCEMCGKETQLFKTSIESSELNVCKSCGGFGRIVKTFNPTRQQKINQIKKEVIESIVSNFAQLIKQSREKRKMTQQEFAKFLNEKESIMHKIETSHYVPDIETIKRFENILKIKLIERLEEEKVEDIKKTKSDVLTIGDIIKLK